jgi:hypothetical protein
MDATSSTKARRPYVGTVYPSAHGTDTLPMTDESRR